MGIQLKTSLIHFYGHCRDISAAKKIFDGIALSERNVVNVSAMMNAFICSDENEAALSLYDSIKDCDDEICAIMAIKACAKTKNLQKGMEIDQRHKHREDSIALKNALIDFYGTMKDVNTAKLIFDSMSECQRDVVSMGSMLKALVQNECNEEALDLYDDFDRERMADSNFVCHLFAIRACTISQNMQKGKEIICKLGSGTGSVSQNVKMKIALIEFYGMCKDEKSAKNVFDSVDDLQKSEAVLVAMMKALIECKRYEEALNVFDEYEGVKKKNVASVIALKACVKMNTLSAFRRGQRIQHHIEKNNMTNSALIDFFGHFKDAKSVKAIFDSMNTNDADIICINSAMNALVNCNESQLALNIFENIAIATNERTQMIALKACGNLGKYERGREIHANLGDSVDENVHFKTALIEFYGNCLDLATAQSIFDGIGDANVVTTSAMMKAFIVNERNEEALKLYDSLPLDKVDKTANLLAIKACGNCANLAKGKLIHSRLGDFENDNQTKTALIDFYGNCRDIESAKDLFLCIEDEHQNIVSIGAMMSAYFVNGCYAECVHLFQHIHALNAQIFADVMTYRLVLSALSKTESSFAEREQIHKMMKEDENAQLLLNDAIIESNLISMYSQNGNLDVCRSIFDEHIEREQSKQALVVWNAMIDAFGKNGLLTEAMALFDRMRESECIQPDVYTHSMLLTACSHRGDMESAERFWSEEITALEMKFDCIVITNLVDCLSRNGHLHKSMEYVKMYEGRESNKNKPYHPMWRSLLGATLKFEDKTMAQHVYDEYAKRFKEDSHKMGDAALLLSNLYAKHSEFEKVEELRKQMNGDKDECVGVNDDKPKFEAEDDLFEITNS